MVTLVVFGEVDRIAHACRLSHKSGSPANRKHKTNNSTIILYSPLHPKVLIFPVSYAIGVNYWYMRNHNLFEQT